MSDTTLDVPSRSHAPSSRAEAGLFGRLAPGLMLTAAIAGLAYAVREIPGASTFSP